MPIRPAIRLKVLPQALPLGARLALARDAGFEGIEADVSEAPAADLRAAADAAGIAVSSIHCLDNYKKPLTSPDPAVRDAGIAATIAALEAAQVTGATTLLLIPGVVGADASFSEVHSRSTQIIRSDILPEAERRGITVCVENVWNSLLLSPLDCVRYVDLFASPRLKLYLDVGNVMFGQPEGWIDLAGERIGALHLKDLRHWRLFGRYRTVRVGEGDIDWGAVRAALGRVGYSGWAVMAETDWALPDVQRWLFRKAQALAGNPVGGLAETWVSRRMVADSMRRFRRYVAPSGARG